MDGVAQPVWVMQPFTAPKPPCDPRCGVGAWTAGSAWYKETSWKTLQKRFSYPITLKPTLDGLKQCLNIYTSFSIAAAAYLDFLPLSLA